MLSASFFIASGVMVEAALRKRASLIGLGLAAVAVVLSVTIEDWLPIAATAAAFLCVIVATEIRSTGDVSRAFFVAAMSAGLASQAEALAARTAYANGWSTEPTEAMITAVCIGLSFAVAGAAHRDPRLLPYAAVGAAALPVELLPATVVWAACGVTFLTLPGLSGAGAAAVVIAAVVAALAVLLV